MGIVQGMGNKEIIEAKNELISYSNMPKNDVLLSIDSKMSGLSSEEVGKRQQGIGKNIFVDKRKKNFFLEFLSYFNSPIIMILIVAAIISSLLNEFTDAIIILIIITISGLLNFFQEHNTTKAVEKLKKKVATTATVIRKGIRKEIHLEDIVPGDIVVLSAGDIIPADLRILEANDFFVNQSSITGESLPQEKSHDPLKVNDPSISDLTNILFFGTSVISGSALAVVIKTGKRTQFGRIAERLAEKGVESDFEKGLKNFSFFIMKITFFLVMFIFLFEYFFRSGSGSSVIDFFLFSVAIAVGITPSLLPMILSITIAKGSLEMAKKGVFVQKLLSIPNFGSMDVLCTDKTGTITENKIVLMKSLSLDNSNSDSVFEYAYLNSLFQTGLKSPMDEAVINFKHMDISSYRKVDEIPFDFVRRRLTIIAEKGKDRMMISKGAPEEILKISNSYTLRKKTFRITKNAKDRFIKQYEDLSRDGFRVLAISVKKLTKEKNEYHVSDESGLSLVGFVIFLDPPKHDVSRTIKKLNKVGVNVKIISGDNEFITQKICKEIGLNVKGILTGNDLEKMDDDALRVKVENTTVFARVSPDDKNRIILALKANHHRVGYLGDGINDAPAIHTADVGISVNSAVDVAKSTADIVLTHKSLKELIDGVYQGRKIFVNTMKYLMFTLSSNFGNMFSVVGAVIILPFLPMLPPQILLNNLLSDFSQISIPTDNVDSESLEMPKNWDISFIKKFMYVFGSTSSLFDFITFILLFFVFKLSIPQFQTGWFLESLATQILVIHIVRTKKLPFIKSIASRDLMLTTFLVLILGWIIPLTPIADFFGFKFPGVVPFIMIIIITLSYLFLTEMIKRKFFKHYYQNSTL